MKFGTSRESSDRIGSGITRTVLNQADDTQLLQELSFNGFPGESQQTIEHAHPYGFSSYPKQPSMVGGVMRYAVAFVSFLRGNRSHGVAFQVGDRRFRLYKMKEGEVALHDDQGQWIHLKRSGVLFKVPNGNTITIQVDQKQDGAAPAAPTMGQDSTQVPTATTTVEIKNNLYAVTAKQGDINLTAQNGQVVVSSSADQNVISTSGNVNITASAGKVKIQANADISVDPGGALVLLGGGGDSGGGFAPVSTVAGPSLNVLARIG
jgi:phage gp45-like